MKVKGNQIETKDTVKISDKSKKIKKTAKTEPIIVFPSQTSIQKSNFKKHKSISKKDRTLAIDQFL